MNETCVIGVFPCGEKASHVQTIRGEMPDGTPTTTYVPLCERHAGMLLRSPVSAQLVITAI